MKKLLNTLYVLSQGSSLSWRNENVCISISGKEVAAVPAHSIDSIVCFGPMTVTTPFLGACASRGVSVIFLSAYGHFEARVHGPVSGNVLLRKKQYLLFDDAKSTLQFAKGFVLAKIQNSKIVLQRVGRGEPRDEGILLAVNQLAEIAAQVSDITDIDSLRGLEGAAATVYFRNLDSLISLQEDWCRFERRSRRPPENEVNAALSFAYALLKREEETALETVGLDPACGCLHALRPGRASLALDLMEELRAPLCDRFVCSLFNLQQLKQSDFRREGNAVYLSDSGKRTFLKAWQKRKEEMITHPFLNEKIPIGLILYTQAMLLARCIRGDLDAYPPFVWR